MKSQFKVVATGLLFPEGPVARPDGSVLVVEIAGGCLTKVLPDGTKERVADLKGGPNGAAIGPDGACYVCNNGGLEFQTDAAGETGPVGRAPDHSGGRIERVDLKNGDFGRVHERTSHGPLSGPNDLVFDRSGGCWFTDLGHLTPKTIDRGAVFYAPPGGAPLRRAIFPLVSPNGIGLSPDESTLYVAESITARLWAFPLAAPGEPVFQDMPPHLSLGKLLYAAPHFCMFDSLAVESGGNICVATLGVAGQQSPGGAGITVVSPEGNLVEAVYLPDRMTTNLCFGGPDLRTAYVTQSRGGRLLAMDWPRAGHPLNFSALGA